MADQEMVEGVEDMQIYYGEDTTADGIADVYRDATSVTNWANVITVRINLLLASLQTNLASQPQTYMFPNDTGDSDKYARKVTAADRRLYLTVSVTIGIRNRLS
jgi:type IV pilus assembly protein PilW